jgi:hypothetical protein
VRSAAMVNTGQHDLSRENVCADFIPRNFLIWRGFTSNALPRWFRVMRSFAASDIDEKSTYRYVGPSPSIILLTRASDTPSPVLYDLSILGNEPPDCDQAKADPALLWPPNHKFREIAITGGTDADGDPVTITVTGISQDEPLEALRHGNFEPDGSGVGTDTAHVRAERQGGGNGRVYLIEFVAEDDKGGECEGFVTVCVPSHDDSVEVCVNDRATYDSTGA